MKTISTKTATEHDYELRYWPKENLYIIYRSDEGKMHQKEIATFYKKEEALKYFDDIQ